MKLPDKIRLGPWIYSVSIEPLDGDHGKSSFDNAYIKINPGQSPERQAGTFYHELGHQWLDIAGVKLPDELEEAVVIAYEHGASSFAKDHPKLFIEIIKEMGKT